MPVPDLETLKLKTRAEYRLLGRRHHGVDDPKIVTGKPLFGIDTQLPGMVYSNFTKCPAVGGKVRSVNLDEVKKLPGVIDAFVVEGNGKIDEVMPGVAIIAKNTWAAFQAKRALKVDWDESEASKDSSTAFSARAREIARTFPEKAEDNVGNVDRAFADAAKTVEAYYNYEFVAHANMEYHSPLARRHHGVVVTDADAQQRHFSSECAGGGTRR
jgi:isoquinoline 1-oxidoreductase subunit beta